MQLNRGNLRTAENQKTRILGNKSLLLLLFLSALIFSFLYLSRGAKKVYSHGGVSTCGARLWDFIAPGSRDISLSFAVDNCKGRPV